MLNILFYTLAIIAIILYVIAIVVAKQDKTEMNYRKYFIRSCIVIVLMIIAIMITYANIDKKDNYIQNIETKLNIYEQSYDEFALEDSLAQ